MDVKGLITLLLWGLGSCITGFLFLMIRIWNLNNEVKDKVSYKWIEDHFEPEIKNEFKDIKDAIKRIEEGIIGTIDKEGLSTIVHDLKKKLNDKE